MGDDGGPQMRALNFKLAVKALDTVSVASRQAILRAVKPETLRHIEGVIDVGWLPLSLNADFTDVVYGVLGREGTRAWGAAVSRLATESPILRALIDASVRVFGVSPKAMLKMMPRTIGAVYRNFGDMKIVVHSDTDVDVELSRLTEHMMSDAYFEAMCGGMEHVFDLCRIPRRRIEYRLDPPAQRAVISCKW